jgi:hypothetical protein
MASRSATSSAIDASIVSRAKPLSSSTGMRLRRADVEPVTRSLNPFARLHLALRGYPRTASGCGSRYVTAVAMGMSGYMHTVAPISKPASKKPSSSAMPMPFGGRRFKPNATIPWLSAPTNDCVAAAAMLKFF